MSFERTNDPVLIMRVCNRALYPLWTLFFLGSGLVLISAALFLPGVADSAGTEASVIAGSGLSLAVAVGLRIAYIKYAAIYTVTNDAITARYGLIARRSHQIRLNHVRSVMVTQSLVGRLLGYGNLEFASAGTNESEIVFKDVRKPMDTKKIVSEILDASSNIGHD